MTATLTALDLTAYAMIAPHAHELAPGDVISVSGDWCRVTTPPVPDQPINPVFVEVEVAPLDRPDRPRTWTILHDARMPVLRQAGAR